MRGRFRKSELVETPPSPAEFLFSAVPCGPLPASGARNAGRYALMAPSGLRSEQLEIFPLFPVTDFGLIAVDLELLDADVVVDEALAEALREAGILPQRRERFLQALGQKGRRRFIRRIGARARVALPRQAAEP